MGHVWHSRGMDAGIDGSIELRDPGTGRMSNRHIFVQSKASDSKFSGEDDERFWYLCEESDIDYWMACNVPVILICSHPKERKAWWVHLQPWFSNPSNRASRRVDFNKGTQELTGDFTGKMFAIADPHGVAHTPVAETKAERLVSNLVEVDVPLAIYSAPTRQRGIPDLYEKQRATNLPVGSDFVLANGRLYTWEPTAGTALAGMVDHDSHPMPFAELGAGGPDDARLAVRLLGAALQHDLRADCRWNNTRRFLHFWPTRDLNERRIPSATGRERLVFKGYGMRKDDPSRPAYFRHAALRAHFTRVLDDWYCELLPDYFYSEDGYKESRFADKYLAKMKRMERNAARLGETLMWANYLTQGDVAPDLFTVQPDRILDFGPLMRFDVDRGVTDKNWLPLRSEESESVNDRGIRDDLEVDDTDGGDDNPDGMLFGPDDWEDSEDL